MPLERHFWRSYLQAAIIPLLLIELGFLGAYWVSSRITYNENVAALDTLSRNYLRDSVVREADAVEEQLDSISRLTGLFAAQTGAALQGTYTPPASEKARYAWSASGAFYTRHGPGQTATFYSGHKPIGPAEIDKVWRTSGIDPLMKDIKNSNPLVSQLYFNTHDSYNRIYPYFDVLDQYPVRMNIPSYNFYYEADAAHNPGRGPVWTDAYVDPAGGGWMVSSIAPVYAGDRLEAVAGIDITIDTIVNQVLDIELPWNGYAVLVGRNGTLLALPPEGERDFGVTELKGHHYREAILSNTFKPERFNITRRPELAALAKTIHNDKHGMVELNLDGRHMVAAHAEITGPDWHLVVLAPPAEIMSHATRLRDRLYMIGAIMVAVLLLFYAAFFVFLSIRARVMARRLSAPLKSVEQVMERFGEGLYDAETPPSGITEIDNLAENLQVLGQRLDTAQQHIAKQQGAIREAFERERRISRGQRRFIDMLSHEFRTPLTVIDSSAQILKRRAASLTPEILSERSDILKRAAERIHAVIDSARQMVRLEESEEGKTICRPKMTDVAHFVRDAAESSSAATNGRKIEIEQPGPVAQAMIDHELIRSTLTALIDNAERFSMPETPIRIRVETVEKALVITVSDEGCGIAAADLPHVCDPFYRGENSIAFPGAGIGLYLASSAAKAHGGSLDIESEEGKGASFTLRIPLEGPKTHRKRGEAR